MIWNLDTKEHTIQTPVRTIGFHTDVILSMSFNMDGSLLATVCRDRKIRIIDPRAGTIFQEASSKSHRMNKVVFLGNLKKLLTTGTSRWNNRQIALWDQDDLSVPLHEEDVDGSSGLLFPFYDTDTHMLYVLSKGDGNIRYYDVNVEKPYLHYLTEYRSPLPQKGIGVMPKRGLDVCACEIFRFYKLIPVKSLIEPISMIVPRRSESYQEDIYPMTAGVQPSLTAQEWLNGTNKGPVLMSLRPGSVILNSLPQFLEKEIAMEATKPVPCRDRVSDITENLNEIREKWGTRKAEERQQQNRRMKLSNGVDTYECLPPKTENELLQMFYRQQEEIRRLREVLIQRDIQIKQLQLEIKNRHVDSRRF
ncbi:coronin-2A isoform X4 [Ahaetulla prasina]|nr:coronin-2A isoform X4 [Ahaetulla prasina]